MSGALRLYDDRVWTISDLDQVSDDVDWRRLEIVDGVLVVSPHAVPRHGAVAARLIRLLGPAVPSDHEALGSMMIDLHPTYRVTDMTVAHRRALAEGVRSARPSDVLLAVEIESPSSITTDRITKPAEYARAGIPFYWRIETAPLRLHTYRLAGDVYQPAGSWGTDEIAQITEPFPVEIVVHALLP